MNVRSAVFHAIDLERDRQEQLVLSGRFRNTAASPDMDDSEAVAVLGEEFGEVCGAVLNRSCSATDRPDADLYKELCHVAAVAVAWMEKLANEH